MSKFITIIRPDFMEFCADACRAATFNHLLFRIAGKAKDQAKEKIQAGDILWYAANDQITEEMSHAWGVCKVRKEVNALIGMGLIGRRSNPEWGADRTKHFCFGQEQCAKFLHYCQEHSICVVHLGLSPEVTHLIYSSNANDKSIKCICSIHQMEAIHLSNANDISIEAITIDSPTEDDYKDNNEEESALSFDQRTARTRSEIIQDDIAETYPDVVDRLERATDGRLKAVTVATSNAAKGGSDATLAPDSGNHLSLQRRVDTDGMVGNGLSRANGDANGQLNTSSQPVSREAEALSTPTANPPGSATKPAARGRNHARAQPKPQLTLQGMQVKEWYEETRGKVRLTDKNIIAFSNLGDEPEMSYDNLKDVLEVWENDDWAKKHNMTPSPQELDGGYLTFEKGLQIVKRNRKAKAEEERKKRPASEQTVSGLPKLEPLGGRR